MTAAWLVVERILRRRPGPISAIGIVVGFLLIISGEPVMQVVGGTFVGLAIAVPFIRFVVMQHPRDPLLKTLAEAPLDPTPAPRDIREAALAANRAYMAGKVVSFEQFLRKGEESTSQASRERA